MHIHTYIRMVVKDDGAAAVGMAVISNVDVEFLLIELLLLM